MKIVIFSILTVALIMEVIMFIWDGGIQNVLGFRLLKIILLTIPILIYAMINIVHFIISIRQEEKTQELPLPPKAKLDEAQSTLSDYDHEQRAIDREKHITPIETRSNTPLKKPYRRLTSKSPIRVSRISLNKKKS